MASGIHTICCTPSAVVCSRFYRNGIAWEASSSFARFLAGLHLDPRPSDFVQRHIIEAIAVNTSITAYFLLLRAHTSCCRSHHVDKVSIRPVSSPLESSTSSLCPPLFRTSTFTHCSPSMYSFHQEQLSYSLLLAQKHHEEPALKTARAPKNSWVMTAPNDPKKFVELPQEKILFTSPPRVSLQISSPNSFPGNEPLSIKSDAGVAYITNQRVSSPFTLLHFYKSEVLLICQAVILTHGSPITR